ncbi:MAG TPA: MFS transporter [Thermoanaerobaculia bacterium]|nr:MFS transporter [Thermoanaerobaculia bacterium]
MNLSRPRQVDSPTPTAQPSATVAGSRAEPGPPAALPAPAAVAAQVDEPRKLVVFGGLILVLLLAALDSTIVATALPTIVGELGGLERLSWVVTAYLLAQTVVMPLYGKLGDLYGRKRVLQTAVLIFLAGSVLCGLSRSMLQLIVFRALQGLGGGGLMVSSQAAIADVVPPRERGRYQGIFGAAFGVASIAGPLLGGFFTTHLSWRWIFYVNLPLGAIALGVLATALPRTGRRVTHRVDYLGALLLAVALAAIVLATDLGGTAYPWSSAPIVGILAAGAAALALFLVVEARAAEPVLPLQLFRNRVFAVSGAVGLIVGFALFGAVTFLPLFLQVVRGQSPTASGLQLVPMMGGMLLTSIGSGQRISRSGRYRMFPIVGTAVMTVGLVLLSRLRPDTGAVALSLALVVVGVGLGMVMQVLVLAVQNAVDFADLGVATSGATLFRFVGGSVGTAVMGAIFTARLGKLLAAAHFDLGGAAGAGLQLRGAALRQLAPAARTTFLALFTQALASIFVVAAAIAALGFLLTWLLPERPLRQTVAASAAGVAEGCAAPPPDSALQQIERGLALLGSRDTQRALLERTAARAGVDLSPAAVWLLGRFDDDPRADVAALASRYAVDRSRLEAGVEALREKGLIAERDGGPPDAARTDAWRERPLTTEGRNVLARLRAARKQELAAALAGWSPERHHELAALITDVARRLADRAPEARPATPAARPA